MSKLKKNILVFAALLIGFCAGTVGKISYELLSDRPYIWNSPPIIINCYGAEFSEVQLVKAIDFWTIHGEEIGFYEINPPKSVCEGDLPLQGFIVLRKAKPWQLETETLASTKRRTSANRMLSAEIWFSPGTYRLDYLIEHELGHALGFNHVEIEGHIMHPLYPKIGPKFWIP